MPILPVYDIFQIGARASGPARAFGRKMIASLASSPLANDKLYRKLPDGTELTATKAGEQYRLTIHSLATSGTDQAVANIWWPRGFVIYPAWHDKPYGVGLPVVQSGVDPNAPANLAPGLDPARWTAGGPCGEVLLTRDKGAGYPDQALAPAPLMFDTQVGVIARWNALISRNWDTRSFTSSWAAYRLEFPAPRARLSGENVAAGKDTLDALNTARAAAGWNAAYPQFRGFASTAELTASLMAAQHSTNPLTPAAYGTYSMRLTKDGYPAASALQVPGASGMLDPTLFTRAYVPWAWEFLGVGAGAGVVAAWKVQVGSHLLDDMGQCVTADVAINNGYAALSLESRDRWIHAGNAWWQSVHADIPPLSWHGFASMNLAWETFPAHLNYAGSPSAALAVTFNFTYPVGDCWLKYRRSTIDEYLPQYNSSNVEVYYEPAMGRNIYMRGRAIAMAPRGGLVWGACVQQITAARDRLIALVHHPEDQPFYAPTPHGDIETGAAATGFTRYLRIWYVDIPRRKNGARMVPEQVVCGEDPKDAWAWLGGTLIDVGVMPPASGFTATGTPNSLKYASVWRFAADGSKAVCLRDYGGAADYATLTASWSAGLAPRAVELTFSVTPLPLTTAVTFYDYTAGVTLNQSTQVSDQVLTPPDSTEVFSAGGLFETTVTPIAVDYDASGNIVYAFNGVMMSFAMVPSGGGRVATGQSQTWAQMGGATTQANPLTTHIYNELHYVGTGDATTKHIKDMQNRVLHGSVLKTNKIDRSPSLAAVLDVVSGTFALKVTRPRFFTDLALTTGPNYPPMLNISTTYSCTTYTSATVSGVMLATGGVADPVDWYPSNDGAIFEEPFDTCQRTVSDPVLVVLPLAVSAAIQGYYAKRFDGTIYGYQISPTPLASMFITAPSTSECGCIYTTPGLAASTLLPTASLNPRGGRVVSSVPLPANDWLIYAKVV